MKTSFGSTCYRERVTSTQRQRGIRSSLGTACGARELFQSRCAVALRLGSDEQGYSFVLRTRDHVSHFGNTIPFEWPALCNHLQRSQGGRLKATIVHCPPW